MSARAFTSVSSYSSFEIKVTDINKINITYTKIITLMSSIVSIMYSYKKI